MLTLFRLDLYYLSFPKDTTHVKALVYFLFVIETIQTVLVRLCIVNKRCALDQLAPMFCSGDH